MYFHSTEHVVRIRRSSADGIYDKILDWLRVENVRIKRQDRPSYIVAEHGSRLACGSERNAKKTIRIALLPRADYIVLHVAMDASRGYKWRYFGAYSDLVEDFLKYLDVETEAASKLDIEGSAILSDDKNNTLKLTATATLLIAIGMTPIFLLIGGHGEYESTVGIALASITIGSVLFIPAYKRMRALRFPSKREFAN